MNYYNLIEINKYPFVIQYNMEVFKMFTLVVYITCCKKNFVNIKTPNFYFGDTAQFISGGNGNVEITDLDKMGDADLSKIMSFWVGLIVFCIINRFNFVFVYSLMIFKGPIFLCMCF